MVFSSKMLWRLVQFHSPDGAQLDAAASELGAFSPAPFKPTTVASLPPKPSVQVVPNSSSIQKSHVSLDGMFQSPPALKRVAPPTAGHTKEDWGELQHKPPADWDSDACAVLPIEQLLLESDQRI